MRMHRKLNYFSLCLILTVLLQNVILAAHLPTWLDLDDEDYDDDGKPMKNVTTTETNVVTTAAGTTDETTAANSMSTDNAAESTTDMDSSSSTDDESTTDMASSSFTDDESTTAMASPSSTAVTTPETTTENSNDLDPLATSCRRNFTLSEAEYNTTLTCYHCRSNTRTDMEPQCDSTFWRYIKYSDRAKFRKPCETELLRGRFCVKIVRKKYRERITERGCSTESIQLPNGKTLKVYNDCYDFKKDGYLTKVCFCDKSFCNGGQKLGADLYLFILLNAFVSLSMFM